MLQNQNLNNGKHTKWTNKKTKTKSRLRDIETGKQVGRKIKRHAYK